MKNIQNIQSFSHWKWLGKINFAFWKIEFWTHWEICAYHQIFGSWKGPAGYTLAKSKMSITKLLSA